MKLMSWEGAGGQRSPVTLPSCHAREDNVARPDAGNSQLIPFADARRWKKPTVVERILIAKRHEHS
jgi:hypothetical protein